MSSTFREDLGFRVWGFRVLALGFKVLGFVVQGFGCIRAVYTYELQSKLLVSPWIMENEMEKKM